MFPDWHELDRWQQQKPRLKPQRMRLGTMFDFYRLPQKLRTEEVAKGFGVGLQNQAVDTAVADVPLGPTMVCGSPYEIANDPSLGGSTERGAMTAHQTNFERTARRRYLQKQKVAAWLMAAMTDPGQLRQRAAWALSQIFAINLLAIKGGQDSTENFVTYYDIFVSSWSGAFEKL